MHYLATGKKQNLARCHFQKKESLNNLCACIDKSFKSKRLYLLIMLKGVLFKEYKQFYTISTLHMHLLTKSSCPAVLL